MSVKSLKIFTVCEIFRADHLKAEKNRVYKGSFLAFCNFVFSSSTQIWSYEFFFLLTGTRKGTNTFNGLAILENSIEGDKINLARKIPILLVAKCYVMK